MIETGDECHVQKFPQTPYDDLFFSIDVHGGLVV